MCKESYGLTKKEYRELIEDDSISAVELMKRISVPDTVYRYRRLGAEDNEHIWVEAKHWEDDVNGVCMFSLPCSFNKNDPYDCSVNFDKTVIAKYMFRNYNRKLRRIASSKSKKQLDEYIESLQKTMLVGCFSTNPPDSCSMWDDPNFGDIGRGICIEYAVDDDNFRPDNLAFLPVLYDDNRYDNTEAMKAVSDYAENNNDINAQRRMVCLGYGHTLIKPLKYEKEQEWRLVIPLRDDKAHLDYFNVNNESKRDFISAIKAIYIGPSFFTLDGADKYIEAIIKKWKSNRIPVYQMNNENGILTKQLC